MTKFLRGFPKLLSEDKNIFFRIALTRYNLEVYGFKQVHPLPRTTETIKTF